ncbi:hypothetical protein ACQP1W_23905 [Spirillospora sp. CA-255316]
MELNVMAGLEMSGASPLPATHFFLSGQCFILPPLPARKTADVLSKTTLRALTFLAREAMTSVSKR